jgi:hypothetical protein
MTLVEHFDYYTLVLGWQVIPVYPKSKVPVGTGWNGRYSIDQHRHFLFRRPTFNLGLLLGDIVDVEGDTPEANEFLDTLLAGVPHPSYRSDKSVHHLFRCPDRRLTALRVNGIEFRGRQHHSVLPPSVHANGARYQWLVRPTIVPDLPGELFSLYQAHKHEGRGANRPKFIRPLCGRCGQEAPVHHKRFELEIRAFKEYGRKWECQRCRTVDVRPKCRAIRASDRKGKAG